jgi:hypothetical protein
MRRRRRWRPQQPRDTSLSPHVALSGRVVTVRWPNPSVDANCGRAQDLEPSSRERLHAAIAYSRPVGNVDPDTDPLTVVSLQSLQPVVVP